MHPDQHESQSSGSAPLATTSSETTTTPESAKPVEEAQRVQSVDVLRGFALLGILVMNINFFGWPGLTMFNPSAAGGFEGLDFLAYQFETLFFSQKFMTIFSMLFGAGLILMATRAAETGRNIRGVYFRRVIWLLVFGLIHAYLIWEGDILFFYGCCALWLYMMRNVGPKWLISIGSVLLLVGMAAMFLMGVGLEFYRMQSVGLEERVAQGETLSANEQELLDGWIETRDNFAGSPEVIGKEIEAYRSGWGTIVGHRALSVLQMHTFGFVFFIGWRVLGLMLIGMGLMKIGFFAARKSWLTYGLTAIIGYAVGLPITYYGMTLLVANGFEPIFSFQQGMLFDYFSSVLVSLGHMSVIMMICKAGKMQTVQRGFAAVGRTALSNYLLHSLVMTSIFYGYGLGFFGTVSRFELLAFVVGMWAVNIAVSLWWLGKFRYGPAEWFWRTLTYGKAPALRRT